jgi:hypothetical protein
MDTNIGQETPGTTPGHSEKPSHLERKVRSGRSIQDLAKELTRVEETKRDFNVPVGMLTATVKPNGNPELNAIDEVALSFKNGEDHSFALNNWSGGQVAAFADIPRQYFKRLNDESPDLLAKNINHGLRRIQKDDETKARLVRTIDGRVRGFMSHRYRMLDSHDLMSAIMPMLVDFNFEVVSCELTEKRLYLKTATPKIQGEIKKGAVVSYGVMISTSDVGAGSLRVEPYFLELWCLNGATSTSSFRKAHLGRSNAEREVQEIMSDNTKRLNDQAFYATVQDYMRHTMKPEIFQSEILKLQDASKREIKNLDLEQVVEVTMQTVGVTGEAVKKGILEALVDGIGHRGLTQWGLMSSFTAAAKMDSLNYDDATDMERAGGQILNLTKNQWARISEVHQ